MHKTRLSGVSAPILACYCAYRMHSHQVTDVDKDNIKLIGFVILAEGLLLRSLCFLFKPMGISSNAQ